MLADSYAVLYWEVYSGQMEAKASTRAESVEGSKVKVLAENLLKIKVVQTNLIQTINYINIKTCHQKQIQKIV